jgi:phosphoribosylformylglycinamidine synthase PurS subunit
MKFSADIQIMPLPDLRDAQGEAVLTSLPRAGVAGAVKVRIGKNIVFTLEADSEEKAREMVQLACEKLLANTNTESFTFSIEPTTEESPEE